MGIHSFLRESFTHTPILCQSDKPRNSFLSHMGRSAFGVTAHVAVHGAVHDAFMTLPPYTRTSEDEVHELGFGVRNCSHSALSDPLSEQSERMERACEATSAEGTARCASRGVMATLGAYRSLADNGKQEISRT